MKRVVSIYVVVAVVVVFALVALVVFKELSVYKDAATKLRDSQVVFVSIFDSVTALPNDYVIDAGVIDGEIRFYAESSVVVIGYGDIVSSGEFFNDIKAASISKIDKCGVSIMSSILNGVNYEVLWDKDNYAILSDVNKVDSERFVQYLCENRDG